MSERRRWLRGEIERWVVDGLVDTAQGTAIRDRYPVSDGVAREGLHALGTMLFGAGIWLVAQTYHIDEHYPTALSIWALGALAMAWALPSVTQGFLAVALVLTWQGLEVFNEPRWHVVMNRDRLPIGALDRAQRFRLVYWPPARPDAGHLATRDLVWHGALASSAFHGRGRVD